VLPFEISTLSLVRFTIIYLWMKRSVSYTHVYGTCHTPLESSANSASNEPTWNSVARL